MSAIREGRILQLCKRYLHKRDIGPGKDLNSRGGPCGPPPEYLLPPKAAKSDE